VVSVRQRHSEVDNSSLSMLDIVRLVRFEDGKAAALATLSDKPVMQNSMLGSSSSSRAYFKIARPPLRFAEPGRGG